MANSDHRPSDPHRAGIRFTPRVLFWTAAFWLVWGTATWLGTDLIGFGFSPIASFVTGMLCGVLGFILYAGVILDVVAFCMERADLEAAEPKNPEEDP